VHGPCPNSEIEFVTHDKKDSESMALKSVDPYCLCIIRFVLVSAVTCDIVLCYSVCVHRMGHYAYLVVF